MSNLHLLWNCVSTIYSSKCTVKHHRELINTHVRTLCLCTSPRECARTHLYTKKFPIKRLSLLDWICSKQLISSMRI